MDDTPNYGFYRKPRFSANHLADYLCTRDASQRDAVIRKAKFPRKAAVAAYQQVTPAFRSFLTNPGGGFKPLDELIERLARKAQQATQPDESWTREEALRCIKAIEAFKVTYAARKWGKVQFLNGPRDVTMKVAGVSVNTRLDPPSMEQAGDQTFSGGCVLFLANTPEGRKHIEERRKYVAAVTHWALEDTQTNLEPLARLCVSFDVFGNEVVRAPTAFQTLRRKMADSCREAAAKWDDIEPPAGYDGPDWK